MNAIETYNPQSGLKNPWMSIFLLVLLFVVANAVGQSIGVVLGSIVSGLSMIDMAQLANPPFDKEKVTALYVAQAVGHFISFTVFGVLFIKFFERQRIQQYFNSLNLNSHNLLLAALMTFSFMLFNSIIIEWNMNVEFPSFLAGFEEWARATEDRLMELTKVLSRFESVGQMLIGIVVIAIIPAVGEELIFRGLLQNKFLVAFKNPHVAIWASALIFGIIHFQFFGLFPRILLGALFGYLYYYSKNLWYPILAHFVNNGLAVVISFYGTNYMEDFDVQEMDQSVPVWISLLGLAATIYLFVLFLKNRKAEEVHE